MTENIKEKTNKTVDNASMASGTAQNAQNNAKVNPHTMHNDTGMKGQKMSDDAKVNTRTMHNDTGMKGQKMSDDARVNTHTMHNDTGMKTQKVSDNVKIDAHKSVSNPKIAGHDAGSKLKKAII